MKGIPTTIAVLLGTAILSYGDTATFSFDPQAGVTQVLNSSSTYVQISNYMTQALQAAGCIGCTVSVTDAGSSGGAQLNQQVYVDQTYTGEGYTVGPNGTPLTLGTSNGATSNSNSSAIHAGTVDNFLSNVSNGSSSAGNQIDIKFNLSPGYTLSGAVSFDFEIFPDGECSELNTDHCGSYNRTTGLYANQPGLTFDVNGAADTSFGDNGTWYGATPGANGPGSEGQDGTSTRSANDNPEKAPQWIGTYSGTVGSYTSLSFIDWPAAIGIDDLKVNFNTPVPEVSSVGLLGTLSLLLIPVVRRMRKA